MEYSLKCPRVGYPRSLRIHRVDEEAPSAAVRRHGAALERRHPTRRKRNGKIESRRCPAAMNAVDGLRDDEPRNGRAQVCRDREPLIWELEKC